MVDGPGKPGLFFVCRRSQGFCINLVVRDLQKLACGWSTYDLTEHSMAVRREVRAHQAGQVIDPQCDEYRPAANQIFCFENPAPLTPAALPDVDVGWAEEGAHLHNAACGVESKQVNRSNGGALAFVLEGHAESKGGFTRHRSNSAFEFDLQ